MVKDNRWGILFIQFISIIFTMIIAVLTWMSFFEHCIADIYTFEQPRIIQSHRPITYVAMAMIGIAVLICICHFVSKVLDQNSDMRNKSGRLLIAYSIIMTSVSIIWIFFNDTVPKFDQEILFKEAKIIAGYEMGEFNTTYFEFYPRNKVIVLLMALLLKILGNFMMSFRILNVVGAVVLLLSISLSVKKLWKKEEVTVLTALLMVMYYPIIIYTCYLYGTLLSAAFGALGVYGVISFCEEKKWKYIIISMFSFPFAVQMHQSAAIMMIAAMFYLFLYTSKKTVLQTVICYTLFVGMLMMSGKIGDVIYERITGVELADSVPALADIYMGISGEGGYGGPGSQNNDNVNLFMDNNYDAEATSEEAWKRIKIIILEYISGERSFNFFVEKTKFQWLDPTFGSRKIIETNDVDKGEPRNSEAYLRMYNSNWRMIGFKILIAGLIMVYSLNLFTVIYQLVKREWDSLHFFIRILLIGGFTFQLLWESISRYCFSYFIWLIPGAAYGVNVLYELFLTKAVKSKDRLKSTEQNI